MGLGVGFIGLGVSNVILAVIGFGGAMLHTLNHAIFKALLFFGAGNVYVSAHSRNMEELGGLIKKMPKTAMIFLIGSLATWFQARLNPSFYFDGGLWLRFSRNWRSLNACLYQNVWCYFPWLAAKGACM